MMSRDEYVARVLALSEQEMAVALLLAAGGEQQAACEQLIGRMRDARRDAARAAAEGQLPRRHGTQPCDTPAAEVLARQDRPVMMP